MIVTYEKSVGTKQPLWRSARGRSTSCSQPAAACNARSSPRSPSGPPPPSRRRLSPLPSTLTPTFHESRGFPPQICLRLRMNPWWRSRLDCWRSGRLQQSEHVPHVPQRSVRLPLCLSSLNYLRYSSRIQLWSVQEAASICILLLTSHSIYSCYASFAVSVPPKLRWN